MPYINLQNY